MRDREYFVYIMTNGANSVLYTGVTNNLRRRVREHKEGVGGYFTSRYKATKLVYFETVNDPRTAISREKQIKGGSRKRKIDLINSMNPDWRDLFEDILP